jgi:arsenate reductase-like glutaredoxin family protein
LATLAGGAATIFSWKSPSARPLGLDETTADPERLIALMAGEPRLIRRPLIMAGGRIAVGADPASLAALLETR